MTTLSERLRGRRVGLALASGFFGFYHHAGVLEAIVERGIRPARLTGASAGALVGSMYCAGLDPPDIGRALLEVRRSDFWDAHWPFTDKGFGLLAGSAFEARLSKVLPVHGFEQCRVPLSVSVYDINTGRVRYLEAGPLVPAVHASCAVPYLFAPVEIDGRRLWDGGFGEKTPLAPFLSGEPVDTVVVSFLPHRDRGVGPKRGPLSLLPPPSSLFASVPGEERRERDAAGIAALEDSGVEVITLAPPRVSLGPFSMERAGDALTRGREGAARILDEEVSHASA